MVWLLDLQALMSSTKTICNGGLTLNLLEYQVNVFFLKKKSEYIALTDKSLMTAASIGFQYGVE